MANVGQPYPTAAPAGGVVAAAEPPMMRVPEAVDGEWILADSLSSHPQLRVDVALERECIGPQAGKLAAVLHVEAPATTGTSRAPLRLVAVLDKSGSMQGEKLRLVIQTMRFMLRHLSECDALGLVEYDTNVKVIAPLTRCSADGRATLDAALQRVRPGTQTNLSGGVLRGLELHKETVRKAGEEPTMLHRIRLGNTYRRLSEEELSGSPKPENVHEWTMELRFDSPEEAALVQKVTYTLHPSFRQPVVVDVFDGPSFQLTRAGWGTFRVGVAIYLCDGRTLDLFHDLQFGAAETFSTFWKPLLSPPESAAEEQDGLVRTTFLFTDGLANNGITKSVDICAAAASMLEELGGMGRRCMLSTFGFGKDHSAELLMGLAEGGQGGIYSVIENEDQIGAAFGEALGGLLSTTHQNTRLYLELEPGVRLARACTEYPVNTQMRDGKICVEIDLGDLYAEERRDVLVELEIPEVIAQEGQGLSSLANLSAHGFSVLAKRSEHAGPMALAVERCTVESTTEGCSLYVERHRCRYLTTEALKSARKSAERGDLSRARQCLKEALEALEKSDLANRGDALFLGFITDLQDCLNDLRDLGSYTSSGSKKMANFQMAHGMQRTMNCETTTVYTTSNQMMMKMRFKENTV